MEMTPLIMIKLQVTGMLILVAILILTMLVGKETTKKLLTASLLLPVLVLVVPITGQLTLAGIIPGPPPFMLPSIHGVLTISALIVSYLIYKWSERELAQILALLALVLLLVNAGFGIAQRLLV